MDSCNLGSRLTLLFATAALLSACGGGGSATSDAIAQAPAPAPAPAPVPPPPPPLAIAGDPPFSSSCSATPGRASIGPFTAQAGDCFVAYQITAQELADFHASYTGAAVRTKVLNAVAANFLDRIDSVVVILDESDQEQGTLPYGINYPVQGCSVHNTACPRFGRLGNLWLTARTYITAGPSLHELLHGFHTGMAADTTANYTIPTVVASHWGFSSAGGQHGGWVPGTLVSTGANAYQANSPTAIAPFVSRTGFGTFANGGNTIPYSNLELWTMGLIPDSALQAVQVAENAVSTGIGTFTATNIATYTPAQIIARVLPAARPLTSTPRAFRALVVVATTSGALPAATVSSLNSDIEQFTMRTTPTIATTGYNFWTASGMSATIQMAKATELAK